MKREARLLLAVRCTDSWAAGILRGPQRVEALYISESLESLALAVKRSRFYDELRYAWPPRLAEVLGVASVEPSSYLGRCAPSTPSYISSFCRVASVIEA